MKPLLPSALHASAASPAGVSPAGAPKVSVLLPTYNRADVLRQAIDSIRAQTLEDWELIVLDDGSTDETQDVMRRYCAKDSRIHYVRQSHFGAPARGLNLGLRLARGEYLYKQDDDDVAYADKLIKCAACLDERTDCSAVMVRWRAYRGTEVQGWNFYMISYFGPLFFRMASVRAAGGWNEFYKLFEDRIIFWKVSPRATRTAKIQDILYDYRKSSEADAPRHRNLASSYCRYDVLSHSMKFLSVWGLPDMVRPHWGLRRALQQIYFVRRHAFLPSACYGHWQAGKRMVVDNFSLQQKKWKAELQNAASSALSWRLLWNAEVQSWREARDQCLPLHWCLRNAWRFARCYFASRHQARML